MTARPRRRLLALRVWRNPLARGTDRAEAAIAVLLAAIWLVALPVVVTLVSAQWAAVQAGESEHQRSVNAVQAVVRKDVIGPVTADASVAAFTVAQVSWTGRDGHTAVGQADVLPNARPGDKVTVWVDASGKLVPQPMTPATASAMTMLSGTGAWIALGLALFGAWWAARRGLDRRRLQAWEREWAQVEPGRYPF